MKCFYKSMTVAFVVSISLTCHTVSKAQSVSVQQPTFRSFSTGTSVLVPDRGGALMGGINRSQSGRNQFGTPLLPFGNTATGHNLGASSVSVHVWIHDLTSLDQMILEQAGYNPNRSKSVRQSVSSDTAQTPIASVADIRRRQAEQDANEQQTALAHFQKAENLVAAGKPGVARIYYRMALRTATGTLKQEILARRSQLENAATTVGTSPGR